MAGNGDDGGITTLGWSPGNGGGDRDGWNNQAGVVPLEWDGRDGWNGWGGPLGRSAQIHCHNLDSIQRSSALTWGRWQRRGVRTVALIWPNSIIAFPGKPGFPWPSLSTENSPPSPPQISVINKNPPGWCEELKPGDVPWCQRVDVPN